MKVSVIKKEKRVNISGRTLRVQLAVAGDRVEEHAVEPGEMLELDARLFAPIKGAGVNHRPSIIDGKWSENGIPLFAKPEDVEEQTAKLEESRSVVSGETLTKDQIIANLQAQLVAAKSGKAASAKDAAKKAAAKKAAEKK